ncbi:hypothetical protein NOK12_24620 [Nocardioides sp. OK12]|uniref:alpha/beta fold hydrolase n=1 Tax=Nocardioides sp. OK12 TaxID=2758661 RepID=UPI0021C281CC|nr:hypothetical protein [Nocardioides sp. OK12]GHJ59944.1 hypothetical protein NOK12_24620 [Nocardioides sp. OK12]
MRPTLRTLLVGLLVGALSGAVVGALAGQAAADGTGGSTVISRGVAFDLVNTNDTHLLCLPDGDDYVVEARLIGPRDEVLGRAGSRRINVLVHDAGTGGWFWGMDSPRRYDYARQLARRGETSLVLTRLGYDENGLGSGRDTCLGAQATMLHQVVQHLKSGSYRFTGDVGTTTPHAGHVVVHGHGVGAAVAQLEASTFDDVEGLVLMSWTDTQFTSRAIAEATRQGTTCLSADYASFGETRADYRDLLFASAPARVQRQAARQRNDVPCGDVLSLGAMVTSLTLGTGDIEAPALLLFGDQDVRTRAGAAERQADRFRSSEAVRTRTFSGAGSALPLERSAPRVRREVLSFLATTRGGRD